MKEDLKIAIGTDAFPPTTDGISNVAQSYTAVLNKNHCKATIITPKNPNQQDSKYLTKFSDIKVGGFRQKKDTAWAGLLKTNCTTKLLIAVLICFTAMHRLPQVTISGV